ncbi:MAG: hypothetical protein AVDCRST_MAG76-519, partial [uncultured Acidimicrobiales bacterium]
ARAAGKRPERPVLRGLCPRPDRVHRHSLRRRQRADRLDGRPPGPDRRRHRHQARAGPLEGHRV